MNKKTKIVLDSDVLIHFSKANCLSVLPKIFPEFEYIILDIVYNEIKTLQDEIDKHIHHFNSFTFIEFNPQGDMFKEYAQLIKSFGRGESACMSYCKYNNDIIGSSNIKDIKDYCKKEKIVYLTTLDFYIMPMRRNF